MKNLKMYQKISSRFLTFTAAMALVVTAGSANVLCWYFLGQEELPKGAERFRKF